MAVHTVAAQNLVNACKYNIVVFFYYKRVWNCLKLRCNLVILILAPNILGVIQAGKVWTATSVYQWMGVVRSMEAALMRRPNAFVTMDGLVRIAIVLNALMVGFYLHDYASISEMISSQ